VGIERKVEAGKPCLVDSLLPSMGDWQWSISFYRYWES